MTGSDLMRQPLAAIRAVQNEKIAGQIALCARGSAFYQRHWAGIDAGNVRSLADLERLPLTTKSALMAEPEAFRLHCPDLPLHERALWEVNYTTGSTGDPTPLYVTTHDYQAYLFQAGRVAEISGVTGRDILANLFPLTAAPMGAFVRSAFAGRRGRDDRAASRDGAVGCHQLCPPRDHARRRTARRFHQRAHVRRDR
jgi:phenylacetate-CoA ligase